MNYKIVRYFLGKIMIILSALMLLPMAVSLYYGENIILYYIIPMACLAAFGGICLVKKPKNNNFHIREGFLICALSWIIMSSFGALPFFLSGWIPSYTDAFFETVSGFTTTGSTILTDIESLPKSLLFWRCFTHWIGGMGVLVFALAILSQKDGKSLYIMKAEVPGPKVGKLVSKTRFTARILYGIYIGMTVLEVIFLLAGRMPLFDSVTTAMSTAGTGGFSPRNASIAFYNSRYIEYTVAIFALLFGVNFTLFYCVLIRNFKEIFKNEELKWYFIIVAAATLIIWKDIYPLYHSLEDSFRASFFQVSSMITTAGFSTVNTNKWPELSQLIIVLLMFSGACAGSTGGGLKVARVIMLIKSAVREIKRAINPKSVISVKIDSHPVDEVLLSSTGAYFIVYILLLTISAMLISLDKNLSFVETLTSVITCMNNVGPGLERIGTVGNFAYLSDLSKWVLSFNMLAGRLELYPIIILFLPSFWRK